MLTNSCPGYTTLVFRPVTLVGFSLGSRIIFKCLLHLAEAGEDNGRNWTMTSTLELAALLSNDTAVPIIIIFPIILKLV